MSILNFFSTNEQREAAEREAIQVAAQAEDFRWLMSDARGRRFVWRQLEQAGIYRISYAGDSTAQTNFNEGQRNLGLWLLAELTEHCHDLYLQMLKENQQ